MRFLSTFSSWILQSRAVAVHTQPLRWCGLAGVFLHRLLCLVMIVHEDLGGNVGFTGIEMELIVRVLSCVGEDRLSIYVW